LALEHEKKLLVVGAGVNVFIDAMEGEKDPGEMEALRSFR
jgi:hypothetical protein